MPPTPDPPPENPEATAPTAHVVVPYTVDKMRDETANAVMAWGGDYTFHPLDPADPYAYCRAVMDWWETGLDLVVIEHDIVPDPGMISALLRCPEPWCGHPYHVGEGRFTTGLGLCKISRSIMEAYPSLAVLAMRDHRGKVGRMHWSGVNEALERQLTRYGYVFHRHETRVEHLHYPLEQPAHD